MKKKIVALFLALALAGTVACGDKKDGGAEKQSKTEQIQETEEEEFVLTNAKGHVVAVDVENIADYVELGEYKNLEVEEAPKKQITDEEAEEYIRQQLLYQYKPVEVTEDRAVKEDDTVNIDYTGYMDGEAFEGGSAEGQDLLIGSGGFIEGFEEGLKGHKKGEEVTLDLTFPEDYQKEDFQGKAAQFKVKINKISQPAELTDQWAAENTDYKTAGEYRTAQKDMLQKQADSDYETQVKSDLFKMVLEASEIKDYPEEVLKEEKKNVEKQMDSMYMEAYGISMDEALEQSGTSEEEADKIMEESAKNYMKQNLIVQAVLSSEGIQMTEKEYAEEEKKYAALFGFEDAESMKQYYPEEKVIKDNVLWNKACDIIMSTAAIKETPEGAEASEEEAQGE